ncbi:hypothetical protein OSB04_006154 [Centaurea solstitialis]|uniref:Uncharacterized protein n=1 Tax=Centaurea solstitialis TaxID=347529 RepID=A0AA38TJ48_9ASTR|nr:hypothetical protein OSB04_006154 [Centaurea solstitialis]
MVSRTFLFLALAFSVVLLVRVTDTEDTTMMEMVDTTMMDMEDTTMMTTATTTSATTTTATMVVDMEVAGLVAVVDVTMEGVSVAVHSKRQLHTNKLKTDSGGIKAHEPSFLSRMEKMVHPII